MINESISDVVSFVETLIYLFIYFYLFLDRMDFLLRLKEVNSFVICSFFFFFFSAALMSNILSFFLLKAIGLLLSF